MGCARRCPTHAEVWLSVLMKFGLKEAPPSQPWLAKILQLTSRYEVSFYEAAYHALALMHKACLSRPTPAMSSELRRWDP